MCLRLSACAWVYLHMTSPLVSVWKSHGETMTMSPSLIQTRRFILPRIRHSLSAPSWHLTMMRSNPKSLVTTPSTSPWAGYFISLIAPSLKTFFFPKQFKPLCVRFLIISSYLLKSMFMILCNVSWRTRVFLPKFFEGLFF